MAWTRQHFEAARAAAGRLGATEIGFTRVRNGVKRTRWYKTK